jgi:hypothetical protein
MNRRSFLGAAGSAFTGGAVLNPHAFAATRATNTARFQATWRSLRNSQTPQWLQDGKFGIYIHWGVYSVPAFGPNGTWYSKAVYTKSDSPTQAPRSDLWAA